MSDLLIEITLAISYLAGIMLISSAVELVKVFDFVIEFYEEI